MKKFDMEITETFQRTVTVEAASREEAERMVDRGWSDGDYVLTDEDYVGVDFKTVGEQELSEKKMLDVLLVRPNEHPQNVSIGAELKDLQEAVGGSIDAVYPFADPVAIICNDEGKLMGLPLNRALGVGDNIGTVHLQKIRLQPKAGFTTAGTADDQHVFVSGILRVRRSVAHHQPFCFCQDDVVCKFRSLKRFDVLGSTPPSRAVLHAVPVFLGVFASQVYGEP